MQCNLWHGCNKASKQIRQNKADPKYCSMFKVEGPTKHIKEEKINWCFHQPGPTLNIIKGTTHEFNYYSHKYY